MKSKFGPKHHFNFNFFVFGLREERESSWIIMVKKESLD